MLLRDRLNQSLLGAERGKHLVGLLLLDVDNGPGWLAAAGNTRLYEAAGLALCRSALRSGGTLAIWSPSLNPELAAGLHTVFAEVAAVQSVEPLQQGTGPTDVVYLAWL